MDDLPVTNINKVLSDDRELHATCLSRSLIVRDNRKGNPHAISTVINLTKILQTLGLYNHPTL